jgi:HK97 family phage major capsid protein
MDERLKRLVARREQAAKDREKLVAQRKAITDLVEEEKRDDLTEEEDAEFRSLTEQIKDVDDGNKDKNIVGLRQLDERINQIAEEANRNQELERSTARMRRAMTEVQVGSEARTYDRGNGRSYFKDLVRVSMGIDGNGESRSRLQRHAEEVETDKEYRDLSRTDTAGGYFVPPIWLMSQAAELARAGRATANVVTNQDLPPGTDSINIPRVATGTSTAAQTADNAPIADVDLTDDFVEAPVRTIAGQQDMALQLIDQSPINFDEVVFRDLVADLATKVDLQVISGTGLTGQALGIRGTANIITIPYTAATPTVAKLYSVMADAVQRVHTQRFMPPQVIVMHPRRWAYLLAAADTTGRPLVLPAANSPQNAMGVLSAVASEQVVGQMHGLPVVTDPNIPTTVNTTRDVILIMRASDSILWESGIRTRTYPTPPATAGGPSTLGVRLEVYEYLAFTAGRYPKSIVEISGTGLAAPTF